MSSPSIDDAYAMGANGGPAVESERIAFEAWMRGHCWSMSATWDGSSYRGFGENGKYVCQEATRTRQLWAAWRDRAALSSQKAQRLTGENADLLDLLRGVMAIIEVVEVDDGIRSEPVIALLDRVNAAFNGQDGGLFDGGEK